MIARRLTRARGFVSVSRAGCAAVAVAALVSLAWSAQRNSLGAETPSPAAGADAALQFRRVYVPADRIQELAKGFLPLKQEEFERLVRRLESGTAGQAAGAAVLRGEYAARLEDQHLVAGEAKLDIAHQALEPVGLPFDTGRLAIAAPTWHESPPRAASLGLAADGQVVLVVEKSGRLVFPWTQRGRKDSLGGVEFDLHLPAAPSNRLTLDLPAGVVPLLDRGVAAPAKSKPTGMGPLPTDRRLWALELGGHTRAMLRLAPESSLTRQAQLLLVRHAHNYVLATSGLTLSAELWVDAFHEPLRRLVLQVDVGLHVTSARLGDKLLPLTMLPIAVEGPSQVVIDFPEPLVGADRTIQVTAVGPLVTGERWKLPSFRAEGAVWQEAAFSLAVREPLILEDVLPTRCRQLKTGPLSAPGSGEMLQFQAFSRDAALELQIGRLPDRLKLLAGTTVTFGAAAVTGITTAEISALQGEQFELECETARLWVIDAVETLPAALLDDWSVVAAGARRQQLRIRFRKALDARGARLIVRGHRQLPTPNAALTVEQLRLATFPGIADSRLLVMLRAEPPLRLEAKGDGELARLDPAKLPAAEAALFEPAPPGLLFLDDAGAAGLRISLPSERPRFTAESAIEVLAGDESLTEAYSFRCRPETSQVGRLFVHFSQRRDIKVKWTLSGAEDHEISSSRRLNDEEQQTAGLRGGETWEIEFRQPRTAPFELQAHRAAPLSEKTLLSLASLPEAESQTGVLAIAVADGASLSIDTEQLQPIPARSSSSDRFTDLRAMYRYDPAGGEQIAITPARGGALPAQAWAWSGSLTSRYSGGRASHTARYQVENQGRGQLVFYLPVGAALEQLLVNGVETSLPSLTENDRRFPVSLPSHIRFPTVTLTYSAEGISPRLWGARGVSPPLPKTDFPVLEQRWTLWLPRGVDILDYPAGLSSDRAPAWNDRLLGPLRARGRGPFALFSAASWRDFFSPGTSAPLAVEKERALELLGELAIAARSSAAESNWQQLFSSYQQLAAKESTSSPPRLLVDANALAAIGLTPSSALPTNGDHVSNGVKNKLTGHAELQAAATGLLTAGNLVLATVGADLVLTSALAPAPRAGEAVSLETWFALEHLPTSPWQNAPPPPFAELGTEGWTAFTLDLPASGQRVVHLYQPHAVRLSAWASLFLVAFLVWVVASRRPRWLIPAAAATGLGALLAEGLWSPLATASFLGVALAALLVLAWRVGTKRSTLREGASTRTIAAPVAAASPAVTMLLAVLPFCLLLLLAVPAARSGAQEPLLGTPAAKVHPVFIPVDEKRLPTSGYVYLPPSFFDALHERDATSGGRARAWLAHSALYQCELENAGLGGKLRVASLTATFDLEVREPKSQIALPIAREGLHLFADRARLNGQAVQVDWAADGKALVLQVEKPDRYQLELALQPSVRGDAAWTGFDAAIPRIPRTKFKVAAPFGTEGLDSPRALGAASTLAETGETLFDLGPTDSLSLRWPAPEGAAKPAELEAEHLLWLKARPGSVVLEGKFRFSLAEGELRELRLSADSRLRLLPPRADQPIARYRVQEGDPQTILLDLKPPHAKEAVLHLSFLVSGASGVGSLVLPRLEPICDRISRRWLAVSLDSDLDADLPASSAEHASDETAIGEFVKAWGRAPAPLLEPQAVYRFSRGNVRWSLAARPKQPETKGTALLDVSFSRDEARVQFEADLATTGGAVFEHRLQTPNTFEVEVVSLKQGAVERVARWSRPNREQVVVFLDAPVTGDQRLVVRGTVPKPPRGDWGIPRLALADAEAPIRQIRLYRLPDCRVRVASAAGFVADSAATLGEHREGFGRLAAALVSSDKPNAAAPRRPLPKPSESPLAAANVTANAPQTQCRLVTAMLRKSGIWEAEVECQLAVDSGLIDVLRFDVPEEWGGPYTVEPAANVRAYALPGQAFRRIEVRPAAALSGDQTLRLRSALSPAPKGRVAAPDVRPLELGNVERFLVVPTQIESQQIAWETSGLQAAPLPLENRGRYPASESYAAYQVVGTSFRAAIKHVERVSGSPLVRLADIHVAWRPDGACHGVALFDLEPAGLRHCLLEMPPQLELVSVYVAGLPALVAPAGSSTWRVELGLDQLPNRVSVVFRGGVPHEESPPRKLRFSAPTLKGLRVEQTLWTIHEPREISLGEPAHSGQTDASGQELLRYQTMAGLVGRAADLVSESSPRETADWYAPWAERLAGSRRALDAVRLEGGDPLFAAAEIAALDREQAALAARLAAGPPPAPNEKLPAGPGRLFDLAHSPGRSPRRCSFSGFENAVELSYGLPAPGDFSTRLLVAGVLLVLSVAAYLLALRGILAEWLACWPYACGVALGLCWWLWLAPSALGWVLVVVSVLGAFRSPWKAARPKSDPLSSLSGSPRRVPR